MCTRCAYQYYAACAVYKLKVNVMVKILENQSHSQYTIRTHYTKPVGDRTGAKTPQEMCMCVCVYDCLQLVSIWLVIHVCL